MDEKQFKIFFGKTLKNIRKEKGFSQEILAEKIGIEIHNLSKIETGSSFPRIKTLIKIMEILNIEPIELFNFGDDIKNNEAIASINKLLFQNPQKIEDFQKVLLAII